MSLGLFLIVIGVFVAALLSWTLGLILIFGGFLVIFWPGVRA